MWNFRGASTQLVCRPRVNAANTIADATYFGGMLNLLSFRNDILTSSIFRILSCRQTSRTGEWAKFWVSRDFKNFARETQKYSARACPIDSPPKRTENAALKSSKECMHNPATKLEGSRIPVIGCITSNQGCALKLIANKILSMFGFIQLCVSMIAWYSAIHCNKEQIAGPR